MLAARVDRLGEVRGAPDTLDQVEHLGEIVGVQLLGDVVSTPLVGLVAERREPGADTGHELTTLVHEQQELRRVLLECALLFLQSGVVVHALSSRERPAGGPPTRGSQPHHRQLGSRTR
ncbi:MAG: hypothetical protein U5R31_11100 [Acidimicrobiia bacterium]|nr:hypothetical protein [Acidimicrobiia bacterium]